MQQIYICLAYVYNHAVDFLFPTLHYLPNLLSQGFLVVWLVTLKVITFELPINIKREESLILFHKFHSLLKVVPEPQSELIVIISRCYFSVNSSL